MVGGAVLNEEYAKLVGADFYAKDALESVKIADKFFGQLDIVISNWHYKP